MKVIKTKINAQDQRGIIRDILTHAPVDAITLITSKKNAVRGNHYHKKTIQYEYILRGSFACFTRKEPKGKKSRHVLKEGDLAVHPPLESHTLKALEDSEMISFTYGPRRGKDYESDTFHLSPPLVK